MKLNYLHYLIIGCILMTVYPSIAQENLQKDYIINLESDTIYGQIDIGPTAARLNHIRFINRESGEEISLSPIDIVGFTTDADTYVSAIVQTEKSEPSGNLLSTVPFLQIEVDTLFLKTEVSGRKNLLSYKNMNGKDYFYIFYEGGYELLMYKKYLNGSAVNPEIAENKSYINLLLAYLNDCPVIHRNMSDLTYSRESLKQLFEVYYQCYETKDQYEGQVMKIRTEKSLLMGPSICQLRFTGDLYPELENTDFGNSINYTFGYSYHVLLTDKMTNWSINNDLMFNWFNTRKEILEYKSDKNYSITTINLAFTYFKLYNMLAYQMPDDKLNLSFGLGISNGMSYYYFNEKKKQSYFYSMVRTLETPAIPKIKRHELGWATSVSIRHKRIGLQFRYEKGNGMSETEDLKARTSRYSLLFRYYL